MKKSNVTNHGLTSAASTFSSRFASPPPAENLNPRPYGHGFKIRKVTRKAYLTVLKLIIFPLFILDLLGSFPEKLAAFSSRTLVYMVIVVTLLSGIYIGSEGNKRYNLYALLTPDLGNQYVLGASTEAKSPRFLNKSPIPFLSSKSVYAVDVKSRKVLLDIKGKTAYPPASTTKLMTALTAVDIYKLDDIVTVQDYCTNIDAQNMGLVAGQTLDVKNLLLSLLINSSADAACVLSNGKVPEEKFVALMNKKAWELNMNATHLTNSVGLDSADGTHSSSAKDLYLLALEADKNPLVREIVKTKETTVVDVTNTYSWDIRSTNDLLWNLPGTVGMKTGRTYGAGEVLIYEYDKSGRDIIIVVMGSRDRFTDTKEVLNWIFDNYSWGF